MVTKFMMLAVIATAMFAASGSHATDYSKVEQELKQSLWIEPTNDNAIDREIRAIYVSATNAFIEGNNAVAIQFYAPDAHVFDAVGSGEETFESMRRKNQGLIDMIQTMTAAPFRDMQIRVFGPDVAYARFFQEFAFTLKDGRKVDFIGRGTDLWLKRNGKWQVVDEHFSVPVDFKTGQANWLSVPAKGYQ